MPSHIPTPASAESIDRLALSAGLVRGTEANLMPGACICTCFEAE